VKASKEQVVEILTFALKKLHLLNFKEILIPSSDIIFDNDKGNDLSGIDLVFKLANTSNKIRLVVSIKENSKGDFVICGNSLQGLQLLGTHNSIWSYRLNTYLHNNYNVYPEDQYFVSHNNWLMYVFNVMYSEHRRNDIETLCNDIGAFILAQLQYACLPVSERCGLEKEKIWPVLMDVDAI